MNSVLKKYILLPYILKLEIAQKYWATYYIFQEYFHKFNTICIPSIFYRYLSDSNKLYINLYRDFEAFTQTIIFKCCVLIICQYVGTILLIYTVGAVSLEWSLYERCRKTTSLRLQFTLILCRDNAFHSSYVWEPVWDPINNTNGPTHWFLPCRENELIIILQRQHWDTKQL